jgi:hypothetical protein
MTRKRSCVVREEADGAGPAMVPRQRPTSSGMCPIVKRLFLTRYAHRISSPLGML